MPSASASPAGGTTTRVDVLLARLDAGEPSAVEQLVDATYHRLTAIARATLSRSSLARNPTVDFADLLQDAALKMVAALRDCAARRDAPKSAGEYFKLFGEQVRRAFIDLYRAVLRRRGQISPPAGMTEGPALTTHDPADLADWTEFHQQVGLLEPKLRATFDLVYYHGRTHADAAEILGVDAKTVGRRWRAARLALADLMTGGLPE